MGIFKKRGTKCVYFKSEDKKIYFESEANLLDLALKNKIDLDHSCGGSGSCGTCRVKITKGLEKIEARGFVEQAMAIDRQFVENERLACQIEPQDGIEVEIPEA